MEWSELNDIVKNDTIMKSSSAGSISLLASDRKLNTVLLSKRRVRMSMYDRECGSISCICTCMWKFCFKFTIAVLTFDIVLSKRRRVRDKVVVSGVDGSIVLNSTIKGLTLAGISQS